MRPTDTLEFDALQAAALARVEADPTVWQKRLTEWCEINTGSRNHAGLMQFLPHLEAAFGVLPGPMTRRDLVPEDVVTTSGRLEAQPLCPALHLHVRPEAPIQLVLTGHYDTVFPVESAFQKVHDLGDGRVNGPGVADMKGGLLIMRDALALFETLPCCLPCRADL